MQSFEKKCLKKTNNDFSRCAPIALKTISSDGTKYLLFKFSSRTGRYAPINIAFIGNVPTTTVTTTGQIGDATKIMVAKNISRLLVEENNKIVGIISQKDVNRETLNVYMVLSSAI